MAFISYQGYSLLDESVSSRFGLIESMITLNIWIEENSRQIFEQMIGIGRLANVFDLSIHFGGKNCSVDSPHYRLVQKA